MKLEKWASIAEIAGGFAIIVTLIILIVEVRGNTDAIRAQTISTQRVAENQRRERVIVNDGDLAELILKGEDWDRLNDVERFRLNVYYNDLLNNFEWQFGEVDAGRLPVERLNSQLWRVIWEGEPGLSIVYGNAKSALDPAFVEYWEANIVSSK